MIPGQKICKKRHVFEAIRLHQTHARALYHLPGQRVGCPGCCQTGIRVNNKQALSCFVVVEVAATILAVLTHLLASLIQLIRES